MGLPVGPGCHEGCVRRSPQALQIATSMPKMSEAVYHHSGDTIGANFMRACQFLNIIDLHLHDLRHDGVSRLFEIGQNIPQVVAVSGHRSWTRLKRYTHLRHSSDKLLKLEMVLGAD
jgi:integrase